jgi:predicted metal-dependent HD superfamily phosphohydrolase
VDLRSRWPLDDEALFRDLVARYREPHRRYHTLQHLEECFARFDELRPLAEHPREVELAIWFHDAIYDTRRSDNETRSAQFAKAATGSMLVHDLVTITSHEAVPQPMDAKVLVDVDLWILGAPQPRFDEYEAQVREEYGWVPAFVYRKKRREVLESFAARPAIYNTAPFVQRYEEQARANLARSLTKR